MTPADWQLAAAWATCWAIAAACGLYRTRTPKGER